MSEKKERKTMPGEALAVVEEFEPGEGTYSNGDSVRAAAVGIAEFDLKQRKVIVKSPVKKPALPTKGDSVEGLVESAQSNVINMRILRINGKPSDANFTGMLSTRQDPQRRGRRITVAKVADLMRATVYSTKNAIIHLALERDNDGVLSTVCSICGGGVVRINDRVKCKECGYVDERMLAPDFRGV